MHRGKEILLEMEILKDQLPVECNKVCECILCQKKDGKYMAAEQLKNEKDARAIVELQNIRPSANGTANLNENNNNGALNLLLRVIINNNDNNDANNNANRGNNGNDPGSVYKDK